ncbi:MAG: NAD(P)-dependent oxidoreductase, partial [Acetobacteraceae bacterium]
MRIGFIGLGQMGAGMAASLLRAGHQVTVYNRTPEKAAPLQREGAIAAASIAAASAGEAVCTMLADDAALERVTLGEGGIVQHLCAGALHVSCGTISVGLSERLAEVHAGRGSRFVAAPVFGRPDVARLGKLFVIAAGEKQALEAAEPLLAAIGQQTFIVSETPKIANLVKLSGNFLMATVIESLGEAMALVGKAGVDRARYLEILTASVFPAPVYKTYGELIARGKFDPAG